MKTFKCPACGGWAFGSTVEIWRNGVSIHGRAEPGDDVRIVGYECHNTVEGEPPWHHEADEFGNIHYVGSRAKLCRWKGPASECGMESE